MKKLISFITKTPSIEYISHKEDKNYWWIKFKIDIKHPLAWNVVQEYGHVLNYLSIEEPLQTVFKPVSPPPYMNGGPDQYLSWVIEPTAENIDPDIIAKWLEGRLPRPVNNMKKWKDEEENK